MFSDIVRNIADLSMAPQTDHYIDSNLSLYETPQNDPSKASKPANKANSFGSGFVSSALSPIAKAGLAGLGAVGAGIEAAPPTPVEFSWDSDDYASSPWAGFSREKDETVPDSDVVREETDEAGKASGYRKLGQDIADQQQAPLDPSYQQTLKDNLDQWQQEQLKRAKQDAEMQLYSDYYNAGIYNPEDDASFQRQLDSIKGMTEVPEWLADRYRRFYDDDGTMKDNPLDWNIFGFTSQQQTPKAVRDVYDYLYSQQDANRFSDGEEYEKWRGTWGRNGSGIVEEDDIDNGVSADAREKLMMTGRQYLAYRDAGIPGRPVGEIDPDAIYSKQDEMEHYGFVPYITSDESLNSFHDDSASHAVNNVFNDLMNLRRANTDYAINAGGESYSGKDFMDNYLKWHKQIEQHDGDYAYNDEPTDEYSVPQTLVRNVGGREISMPGTPSIDIDKGTGAETWKFYDASGNEIEGADWVFPSTAARKSEVDTKFADDDDYICGYLDIPPLELDSGQKIRADKAGEIYDNRDAYSDYGLFDIGKPAVEDPFEEGGWLPWIIDMALSSAPYFYLPASGAKAVADTASNYKGFQPGYQNYLDRSYRLLSEDPTQMEQATATLGSAVMPITEQLWGGIGHNLLGSPFKSIAKLFGAKTTPKVLGSGKVVEDLSNPILRIIDDAVGEGLEEIPGNAVEEFQQNGLNWYGNPVYKTDDNGELLLDSKGNPIPDIDTQGRANKNPAGWESIGNYVESWPLAFTGGAILGGAHGAPMTAARAASDAYNEMKTKKDRDKFTISDEDREAIIRALAR